MDLHFLIGGVVVSALAAAIILLLLRPLARGEHHSRFSLRPEDLGGYTTTGLVLSSVLGLYLELMLIRWISSEIRIFAYFKNFVLIACFLGFGLGCYLARRAISILTLCVPVVFFTAAIALPFAPLRTVIDALPQLLGASSEVFIWGAAENLTGNAWVGLLVAAVIVLPLFILIAITFIPVGQLVGWYLESAPNGITAYSVNVLASLAGIALYTVLSFMNTAPVVWLTVAGVIAVALFWRVPAVRWAMVATFGVCIAIAAVQFVTTPNVYWSPYQKLTVTPIDNAGKRFGYQLQTNGSWYQSAFDLPLFLIARGGKAGDFNGYDLPYRFAPAPSNVLVLGSGMGNDVAAALRNHSARVTAVEIDPMILALGRKLHPEHPYSSPKVHVVIDDARSYVQNTSDRFDLIVFSLLDSHTTASHFTNIRIDNYVYTREAIDAARRLLNPDGIFIVKFQVQRKPWIVGRLNDLLTETFGYSPLQLEDVSGDTTWGHFFVTGSPRRINATLRGDPRLAQYIGARMGTPMESVALTTDDWPFFYQRNPGLPTSVVTISALLILISLLAAKQIGLGFASLRLEFFFLGAGFMLLEAQIISRMALLFGTTWLVNSIVIAVLLLLIVAANGVVASFPKLNVDIAYPAIVITLAINYIIPIQALFFRSFALRATVATIVLCAPVFFAGMVFTKRFAAAGFAAEAIGSNLLGALAGGIAESLSLWFGFRALLGIAAALYLASWLQYRKKPTPAPAGDPAWASSTVNP